jgi:hypothetical protein
MGAEDPSLPLTPPTPNRRPPDRRQRVEKSGGEKPWKKAVERSIARPINRCQWKKRSFLPSFLPSIWILGAGQIAGACRCRRRRRRRRRRNPPPHALRH